VAGRSRLPNSIGASSPMRLTLISQACLLIEADGERLIIDPWILGSCYWRSWWPFPPARPELVEPQTISAIYITHEHPDHLHYPSLRRFPKGVRILVPSFPVDRMAEQIRNRGFTRVEEIPHGGEARVGRLCLFSYQAGQDDSIVVVTDGETTILNMNDAKASGSTLNHILKRHPRVDFFLRSHAPAQAFPFCYTAEDPRELDLLPRSYYLRLFRSAVRAIRPRFAIPFASNMCHLHPESLEQNENLISPDEVLEACEGQVGDTELVAMSPGDSWERGVGFNLAPRLSADERRDWIARLRVDREETLGKALAEERALGPVEFGVFRAYLESFLKAVPWLLRGAFPARVAFEMPEGHYFLVDVGQGLVDDVPQVPERLHSVIRANPCMMRDAIAKGALNLIGISRRIRVHLQRGGATLDAAFWGLLSIYELGYLPMSNILTRRGLAGLLARWREILSYLPALAFRDRSLALIIESKTPKG
jgi:UDP-MurNAc hydroxylase